MQAAVQHSGEFLRGAVLRQVRPPDIADEQSISGQHGERLGRTFQVCGEDAHARYASES